MKVRQKNIFIFVLLLIIAVMAVGYAAFASNLNISVTSTTNNNWDVHIKSITPSLIASYTNNGGQIIYTSAGSTKHIVKDSYTAEFEAILLSPSETVTYTVEIENSGNVDAKLANDGIVFTDATMTEQNPEDAILFSYSNIAPGDVIRANGGTATFTVAATYNPNVTSQPSTEQLEKEVTMTLNYVQA